MNIARLGAEQALFVSLVLKFEDLFLMRKKMFCFVLVLVDTLIGVIPMFIYYEMMLETLA